MLKADSRNLGRGRLSCFYGEYVEHKRDTYQNPNDAKHPILPHQHHLPHGEVPAAYRISYNLSDPCGQRHYTTKHKNCQTKPRFRLESGLLFAEKCDNLAVVLPINGKRAAPHRVSRRENVFLRPPTERKGGNGLWSHTRTCSSFACS